MHLPTATTDRGRGCPAGGDMRVTMVRLAEVQVALTSPLDWLRVHSRTNGKVSCEHQKPNARAVWQTILGQNSRLYYPGSSLCIFSSGGFISDFCGLLNGTTLVVVARGPPGGGGAWF